MRKIKSDLVHGLVKDIEPDENGNFWWREGWYEEPEEAEQAFSLHNVTHWMPLPDKP